MSGGAAVGAADGEDFSREPVASVYCPVCAAIMRVCWAEASKEAFDMCLEVLSATHLAKKKSKVKECGNVGMRAWMLCAGRLEPNKAATH